VLFFVGGVTWCRCCWFEARRRRELFFVQRYVLVVRMGEYVLPFPTFVLELACVAAHVRGHASPTMWHCQLLFFHACVGGGLRTHCTPKSPVLNTSILFNPKHANISTLHLPRPRTATSFSINSSSLALTSICAVSSPLANFSASPEMYSALRWDKPAVRRVGRSFAMTCVGEGKAGCVSSKRAVNFLRMEAAAWPET
jgi:hypothetical protein